MRREISFLFIEFVLFTIYFIDMDFLQIIVPSWAENLLIFLLIFGVTIIFFGIINLNDDLTYFSSEKKEVDLRFKGIYNFVRHPIFSGILICMFSFALFSYSAFRVVLTGCMGLVFYFKSVHEGKWLLQNFIQFRKYKKSTGRFFPRFYKKKQF